MTAAQQEGEEIARLYRRRSMLKRSKEAEVQCAAQLGLLGYP